MTTIARDLPDAAATDALGAALAPLLRRRDVIALSGELGTGKTTLVRALLRGLGHTGEVPSPTFTLVQTYEFARITVWHFDLYRVAGADEVIELGFEEALTDGVTVIEWPERLGSLLPADRLDVRLTYATGPGGRRAVLTGRGSWRDRLAEAADGI